jgi:outer membrane protein TolC
VAEEAQTRELLASSVARLYWQWQTEAAVKTVLQQVKSEQNNIVSVDQALYQRGITNSAEGRKTISTSAKPTSSWRTCGQHERD